MEFVQLNEMGEDRPWDNKRVPVIYSEATDRVYIGIPGGHHFPLAGRIQDDEGQVPYFKYPQGFYIAPEYGVEDGRDAQKAGMYWWQGEPREGLNEEIINYINQNIKIAKKITIITVNAQLREYRPGEHPFIYSLANNKIWITKQPSMHGKLMDGITSQVDRVQAMEAYSMYDETRGCIGYFKPSQGTFYYYNNDGMIDGLAGALQEALGLARTAAKDPLDGYSVPMRKFIYINGELIMGERSTVARAPHHTDLMLDSELGDRRGDPWEAMDEGKVFLGAVTLADGYHPYKAFVGSDAEVVPAGTAFVWGESIPNDLMQQVIKAEPRTTRFERMNSWADMEVVERREANWGKSDVLAHKFIYDRDSDEMIWADTVDRWFSGKEHHFGLLQDRDRSLGMQFRDNIETGGVLLEAGINPWGDEDFEPPLALVYSELDEKLVQHIRAKYPDVKFKLRQPVAKKKKKKKKRKLQRGYDRAKRVFIMPHAEDPSMLGMWMMMVDGWAFAKTAYKPDYYDDEEGSYDDYDSYDDADWDLPSAAELVTYDPSTWWKFVHHQGRDELWVWPVGDIYTRPWHEQVMDAHGYNMMNDPIAFGYVKNGEFEFYASNADEDVTRLRLQEWIAPKPIHDENQLKLFSAAPALESFYFDGSRLFRAEDGHPGLALSLIGKTFDELEEADDGSGDCMKLYEWTEPLKKPGSVWGYIEHGKYVYIGSGTFGMNFPEEDKNRAFEAVQQIYPDSELQLTHNYGKISQVDTYSVLQLVEGDPAASAAYRALSGAGGTVYVVGGALRDIMLGKQPKDVDLMVRGLPEDQVEQVLSSVGTVNLTGKQFGVFRLRVADSEVEIALPRTEVSTGPRHEDFDIRADHTLAVEDDLLRRDFTANAMAFNLDGGYVIDPHGGQQAIEQRQLSLVSEDSFRDDPLRIVRALVAQARHGLEPDASVIESMKAHATSIRHIPSERIQQEMDKLLGGENPVRAIEIAVESDLIDYLIPELSEAFGFDQMNPHHDLDVGAHSLKVLEKMAQLSDDPDLRLAALLHDVGKPSSFWRDESAPEGGGGHFYKKVKDDGEVVGRDHDAEGESIAREFMNRMRYPAKRIERVTTLIRNHMFPYFNGEKGARRFLNNIGGDIQLAKDLLLLREADASGKGSGEMTLYDQEQLEIAKEMLDAVTGKDQAFTVKDLAVNGNDLIDMGLKPGPEIGKILKDLLEIVLDNPELNTRQDLIGMLEDHPSLRKEAAGRFDYQAWGDEVDWEDDIPTRKPKTKKKKEVFKEEDDDWMTEWQQHIKDKEWDETGIPYPGGQQKSWMQPDFKWSYDGTDLLMWKVDEWGQPHHIQVTGPKFYTLGQGRIYTNAKGEIDLFVWEDRGTPELRQQAIWAVEDWILDHYGQPADTITYEGEGIQWMGLGRDPNQDEIAKYYYDPDEDNTVTFDDENEISYGEPGGNEFENAGIRVYDSWDDYLEQSQKSINDMTAEEYEQWEQNN